MPREKRDDTAVKINSKLYRKAKVIAAFRGVTIAEYLSEKLEKPVDRDFAELRAQMDRPDQD